MMKNKVCILLAAALITVGMCLSVQAEADSEKTFEPPEDELEINYVKGHSSKNLSVIFNHSSHTDYECVDCHHKMEKLKGEAPPRSCSVCHNNFSPDDLKGNKSYFKAMHTIRFAPAADRPSCLACHTKVFGKEDKDMTGCNASACHSEGIR